MQEGWICPRCRRILAPWVQVCPCSIPVVLPESIPWTPPYDPPWNTPSTGDPLPMVPYTTCESKGE